MDPELKTALDGWRDQLLKGLPDKKALDDLHDRFDELEVKLQRPGVGRLDDRLNRHQVEHKAAFEVWVRKGDDREIKGLESTVDPSGGYLAPDDFKAELERNLVEFSPVRRAARVGQTSSGSVKLPKRSAALTGYWTAETATRTETSPTYGMSEIQIHEIAAYVDVSNVLLDDAAFDMNAELSMDFAEAFGAVEGTAFVNGNGVGQPLGIMSVTGITEVNSGAAAAVTADSLRTTLYDLPAYYRQRSTWLMNGTTLGNVAKLKDGSGQYLWQPGMRDGDPDVLLGRPVIEATDMADEGAGVFPVVLGDFSRYRIFDRVSIAVLRDPYSIATSGQTRFHARRRVGAMPTMVEAFRKLKCSV